MKDLGEVRLGAVGLRCSLLFKLRFSVAVAEQTIGYGYPNNEKVEEFPASGEDGLVHGLWRLGGKKREEGEEDGEEDGFVEEIGEEFS